MKKLLIFIIFLVHASFLSGVERKGLGVAVEDFIDPNAEGMEFDTSYNNQFYATLQNSDIVELVWWGLYGSRNDLSKISHRTHFKINIDDKKLKIELQKILFKFLSAFKEFDNLLSDKTFIPMLLNKLFDTQWIIIKEQNIFIEKVIVLYIDKIMSTPEEYVLQIIVKKHDDKNMCRLGLCTSLKYLKSILEVG